MSRQDVVAEPATAAAAEDVAAVPAVVAAVSAVVAAVSAAEEVAAAKDSAVFVADARAANAVARVEQVNRFFKFHCNYRFELAMPRVGYLTGHLRLTFVFPNVVALDICVRRALDFETLIHMYAHMSGTDKWPHRLYATMHEMHQVSEVIAAR
jgi:hypothetical protein